MKLFLFACTYMIKRNIYCVWARHSFILEKKKIIRINNGRFDNKNSTPFDKLVEYENLVSRKRYI